MNEESSQRIESHLRTIVGIITIALIICAVLFAASPLLYLWRLMEVVDAGDTNGVAAMVDMAAIPDGLGDAIAERVTQKVDRKGWRRVFGRATRVVTRHTLSPELLTDILAGRVFPGTDSGAGFTSIDGLNYDGWSYFWIDLEVEEIRMIRLRLRRKGLASWELYSIRLKEDYQRTREEEEEARRAEREEREAALIEERTEAARELLGDDFISPEEIASARGLRYSEEQTAELYRTLPNRGTVEWLEQNGYTLVAGPPYEVSLLDINSRFLLAGGDDWRTNERETFAREEKVSCRWYMLRGGWTPNSPGKTWSEQVSLLQSGETVPTAVELLWALTSHKAVRGTYLVSDMFLRTSSVDANGNHVYVARQNEGGFYLSGWDDSSTSDRLGLASAREP